MSLSPQEIQSLTQAGVAALQAGEAARARQLFERLLAAGRTDATTQLGLAYACAAQQDREAALTAVDAALALAPHELRALILKADLAAAGGDSRMAAAHYQAALKVAPPAEQLPPALRDELARAAAMCERLAAELEQQLRARLPDQGSPRFARSLDLLFGKARRYRSEPRLYYFPGLPEHEFFGRADWFAQLEAATPVIQSELRAVLADHAAFRPYVESDPARPALRRDGMLDNPDWSAFYLWKNGAPVPGNVERCPRTMAALADLPLARVPGRSPSVLFSLLRPGARIPPHNGFINTRLICHLPLIVPPGCGFRVGNETRAWVEGRAWLFDDTIEHEAWNDSDAVRVILLFEVWRPELDAGERAQVGALFEQLAEQAGDRGEDWAL